METRRIRCPNCDTSTEVGVPPSEGRTRRVVTQCGGCAYDLVVSRDADKKRDPENPGAMRIRACQRWETTCPYCKEATVARVPPKGTLRRKETTPCGHCRRPLIVERREEGTLVLRAHRGMVEGFAL
jgi:hypothetical protein